MRFAVSLEVFSKSGMPLPTLISEVAEAGFDAVSMGPQQMLQLSGDQQQDALRCLDEHAFKVALHTQFSVPFEDVRSVIDLLGSRLVDVTFDSMVRWTSAGFIFDVIRIVPYLQKLDESARKHGFLYGVEDFPEDAWALRMYRNDLSPLLESPRYGVLIDVGHLNLSIRKYKYIEVPVEQYFADLPVPLIEVHLSDNDGEDDQHKPLGAGNVDFAAAARGLKRIGFNGITTIEIEQKRRTSAAQARRQVTESLNYWRQMLEKT